MKKVIVFIALAAIVIGCKQEKEALSPDSYIIDNKKLSELFKEELKLKKHGCNNIVVVDLNKIQSPQERAEWVVANQNEYGCEKEPISASVSYCGVNDPCSNNLAVIDLLLIKDKNTAGGKDEDANILERAKWLRKNADIICYEATYPHFKESHEITSSKLLKLMLDVPHYDTDFASLKAEINAQANVLFKTVGLEYFDNDHYNIYAKISVKDGVVKVKVIDEYDGDSFSIPFLRSIKTRVCTAATPDPDIKFEVYRFVIDGNFLTGFRIKDAAGKDIGYLNYSTDPK